MPEPIPPSTLPRDLGALWRHRALVLGAGYAFVALVGALYFALLLGDFGLNAFDYWEASDFLLASFREPVALVFGAFAVYIYFAFTDPVAMNDRFYGRWPWFARLVRYERWRESRWMAPRFGPLAALAFAVLWFALVMGGIAIDAAAAARQGRGERVMATIDGARIDAQLLATTNRFVFLVEPGATPAQARLLAVPIDALSQLDHCGARRGGLRALIRGPERCADGAAIAAPAPSPAPPSGAP